MCFAQISDSGYSERLFINNSLMNGVNFPTCTQRSIENELNVNESVISDEVEPMESKDQNMSTSTVSRSSQPIYPKLELGEENSRRSASPPNLLQVNCNQIPCLLQNYLIRKLFAGIP